MTNEEIIEAYNNGYLVDTRTNAMYAYNTRSLAEDKFIKELETAIGFKLLAWQKHYIFEYGKVRRSGETTAQILALLLNTAEKAADIRTVETMQKYFVRSLTVMRAYQLQKDIIDMKRKLTAAGIPTRKLLCKHDRIIY